MLDIGHSFDRNRTDDHGINKRLVKMKKKLIIPPTRAVATADELRRRILDGEYPGGMQLRQAVLAEELGISRIPFREALGPPARDAPPKRKQE